LPARRRAAPAGASAATEKPSQRQRSPEPLPWFEQWDEARSRFAVDHADLRKTAPQLLRRIDVIAERFDSIR